VSETRQHSIPPHLFIFAVTSVGKEISEVVCCKLSLLVLGDASLLCNLVRQLFIPYDCANGRLSQMRQLNVGYTAEPKGKRGI